MGDERTDDQSDNTGRLDIKHTIFVNDFRTADYQTTSGIVKILDNKGNKDDLLAFFQERMLPADEIEANQIAEELLQSKPIVGYLVPERKRDFSSSSRQIKILTTGIHRVFRGLKFLFNAEIGGKDHFRSGTI